MAWIDTNCVVGRVFRERIKRSTIAAWNPLITEMWYFNADREVKKKKNLYVTEMYVIKIQLCAFFWSSVELGAY